MKATGAGLLMLALVSMVALPAQGVLIQTPPSPLFTMAIYADENGNGRAVGQCDEFAFTCAAAAADAGGACFVGSATVPVFPDPNFQICATWGVAVEGTATGMIVHASDRGEAMVISYMADESEEVEECEFISYTHDYVYEKCRTYTWVTAHEEEVSRGRCNQHLFWSVPPLPTEILQRNTCISNAHEFGGALCHKAWAIAKADVSGFSSSAETEANSCDSERIKGIGGSVVEDGSDEPRAIITIISELDPIDQERLRESLTREFQQHLAGLETAFDGNDDPINELGRRVLGSLVDDFEEAISSPDLPVLLGPAE